MLLARVIVGLLTLLAFFAWEPAANADVSPAALPIAISNDQVAGAFLDPLAKFVVAAVDPPAPTGAARTGRQIAVPTARSARSVFSSTPGSDILAINCGGGATGSWVADEYYGNAIGAAQVTTPISTAGVSNPAPQAVYDSFRFPTSGPMTYTIPGLTAGAAYTIRLHFAAFFDTAAGQRVFNVSINGTQVLTNFDIFATAGAPNTAVIEQVNTVANASGQIVILFTDVVNVPIINGIEVRASTSRS